MRHMQTPLSWIYVTITLLSCCCQYGGSSKILMATMGGTKSHKIPFLELARGLIARGHNVTFVNAFPSDSEIAGLEEITPLNFVFYVRNYTNWDLLGVRMSGREAVPLADVLRYGYYSCDALLSDPEIYHLMNSERSYDLVIVDGSYPECPVAFAHHFHAPFMYINSVAFYTGSISHGGSPAPYSVTPFLARSFIDNMVFMDRVLNTLYYTAIKVANTVFIRWYVDGLLKHYFGPTMPHVYDFVKNVSFILQNGHATVTYPRPYLPNVAEVACIHCRAAKPLPKDLEDFVSGSESGFIYVSMGTSVLTAKMPEVLRLMFIRVFAQLPYRVLWKWEAGEESIPDLPPNVRLGRWLPQQDILGHRKIRAFVTHGGLLSMFETVYHGVPVVTMPVFCDHDANSAKAELDGYALKLELQDLTAEKLLWAINQIIHNPKYREGVRKRSMLLRDQEEHPLDRAIYWTEYVLRHNGAYHLQSPAREYSFVQYYLIDVVLFYFVVSYIFLKILVKLNKIIFKVLLSFVPNPPSSSEDELILMKKKVKMSLANGISTDISVKNGEALINGATLRNGTVTNGTVTNGTVTNGVTAASSLLNGTVNKHEKYVSNCVNGYKSLSNGETVTSHLKLLQSPVKTIKLH